MPMQTVKMVITGPYASGKTEFIKSISEIDVRFALCSRRGRTYARDVVAQDSDRVDSHLLIPDDEVEAQIRRVDVEGCGTPLSPAGVGRPRPIAGDIDSDRCGIEISIASGYGNASARIIGVNGGECPSNPARRIATTSPDKWIGCQAVLVARIIDSVSVARVSVSVRR